MPRGKLTSPIGQDVGDHDLPMQSVKDEVMMMKVERIIRESADLFFRNGYMQTKMSDIADRLGVTKPFIYYHFDSKAKILIEICERGTRDALEAVELAVQGKSDPLERFEAFVRAFTNSVLEDYKFVLIYFREEINLPPESAGKITRMRRTINDMLIEILEDGAKAGLFKVNSAQLSAFIVAGMASYVFAWYRGDGKYAKDEVIDEIASSSLKIIL